MNAHRPGSVVAAGVRCALRWSRVQRLQIGVLLITSYYRCSTGHANISNEAREARSAESFFLGFPRKKSLYITDRIRG